MGSELACVYAALILADDDVAITSEKITTILKAANVEVESYWPGLFAKALESVDVKTLITNVGSGAGAAPAAGGAAPVLEPLLPRRRRKKKRRKNPSRKRMTTWDSGSSTKFFLKCVLHRHVLLKTFL